MSGRAGNSAPTSQQILESLLTFELDKNVRESIPPNGKNGESYHDELKSELFCSIDFIRNEIILG